MVRTLGFYTYTPEDLNNLVWRYSGPIFSLDFAGKPVVVLNTYETATDLLGTLLS